MKETVRTIEIRACAIAGMVVIITVTHPMSGVEATKGLAYAWAKE